MFRIMGATVMSAVLAAGAAQAGSQAVKYDDLDLGRPSDAQAYKARIAKAVDRTCEREATSGMNFAAEKLNCERRTRASLMSALPEDVRGVYLAALNGQASDSLTRARLAAAETTTTVR